ncbi:vitamin K epoxide reductase family protein [Rhodopirellula europaea]|uniref:vitamin K epoxide reductase family protein n=1 Tax=Rhodopirellula europaea TaxID=1263866 RepID=UPI003D2D4FDD
MGDGEMTPEMRRKMRDKHHQQTEWIWWTLILLGVWMVAAPFSFDYGHNPASPAASDASPLSMQTRINGMIWSDVISGLLLIVLGWRSLKPGRPITLWAACFVGIWMNAAPLVFWSPSAAGYLNNTIVGTLVIAFTILIPGMPSMIMMMKMGPEVPRGWTYNPSSWPQRAIMIGLGFAGWLVSRYLSAYQLGYIDYAWDPFFGKSTMSVLESNVSRSLPVSDAGLGALAYTIEFLMGYMGGTSRWRTMPWMVTFFGILVVPLGLTHIVLVISQPVIVGQWCTFCLLAALIMLPMIPLTLDEVVAMCQFMVQAKREGKPFWKTFWKGGTVEGEGADERSPRLTAKPSQVWSAMVWGMTAPWTLVVCTAAGFWLMLAPWVLNVSGDIASGTQVAGALIITVSVVVMAEVARAGRFLNILLALWIVALPWLYGGVSTLFMANNVVLGIALIALSIPRGTIKQRYGSWDRFIV